MESYWALKGSEFEWCPTGHCRDLTLSGVLLGTVGI